jgi:hypothetical protein
MGDQAKLGGEMKTSENPDVVNIKLGLRSSFAVQHLRAAAQAARKAYEIEQANLTAEHGPWFDEMMLFVPVSVVMAGLRSKLTRTSSFKISSTAPAACRSRGPSNCSSKS